MTWSHTPGVSSGWMNSQIGCARNSSAVKPSMSHNARLTSRMVPSMSPTPMPMTESANTASNRASLSHRACSAATRAANAEALIRSCSARVRSRSAWA